MTSMPSPKPAWITVVGVFLILFGATALLRGASTMATPWIVDMQKEMFGSMQKLVEQEAAKQAQAGDPDAERRAQEAAQAAQVFSSFDKFLDIPDWYRQWSPLLGLVTLVIGGFYLLAGILFLMVRRNADQLVLAALAASVAWALVTAYVALQSDALFVQSLLPNAIIGIVIDVVLAIVVVVSDRQLFRSAAGPGQDGVAM